MEKEELVKTINETLDSFKKSLPNFVDDASLKTAFADFKVEIMKSFGDEAAKGISNLEEAVKKQGETLAALKNQAPQKAQTFRDMLVANKEQLQQMAEGKLKRMEINTTTKDILSTSHTDSTLAYREPGVGQIQRGMPFMADLFPTVRLTTNTGGVVRWSEQLAVTNNAANIAEATAPTTQSNLTWVEKSIEGKRIVDFIKIGLDDIKDVDYVLGEVQGLINKNMKIKENSQLINGLGTGNEIAGINTYATEFVTEGVSTVIAPNLVDLVNKIGLQIMIDMLGGAAMTNFVANPIDIQPLKEAKDTNGRYIFENWALGQNPAIAGAPYVSNPLMTADTLLAGDFNMGTLFVFDDLLIDMVRTENDELTRKVTI